MSMNDAAEVLMDLDEAKGSLDTCRCYVKHLETQVCALKGALQQVILRTNDPRAREIALVALNAEE